ncbi:MAG: hypothetical protein JWN30_394 [Bacilli bacterium]|nr:hypothetical protein [Bacilli bacterium]
MTNEQTGEVQPTPIQRPTVSLTIEELALLTGGSRAKTSTLPPRSEKHGRKKRLVNKAKAMPRSEPGDIVAVQVMETQPASLTVAQRVARQANRLAAAVLGVVFFIAMLFWAKFAYVYNIPDFMTKDGSINGAAGYICYKPWWFGSPLFSLQQLIKNNGGQNDRTSLQNILHDDTAVIDNPVVVWRYYRK